jgi:hypothetical protein
VLRHVRYSLSRAPKGLPARDLFRAGALAVRDRIVDRLLETQARQEAADAKPPVG